MDLQDLHEKTGKNFFLKVYPQETENDPFLEIYEFAKVRGIKQFKSIMREGTLMVPMTIVLTIFKSYNDEVWSTEYKDGDYAYEFHVDDTHMNGTKILFLFPAYSMLEAAIVGEKMNKSLVTLFHPDIDTPPKGTPLPNSLRKV